MKDERLFTIDSEEVMYLIQKDPSLKPLFESIDAVKVTFFPKYFEFLVLTILGQQLSTTVAKVLETRFLNFYDNVLDPSVILKTDDEDLRALGLSKQKVAYIKALADAKINNVLDSEHLNTLSNEETMKHLTTIYGVGPWTAEMFLMFSKKQLDVFSSRDLGLKKAYEKFFDQNNLSVQELDLIAESWSPYQSVVAHYLWAYWDNK